MCPKSRFQSRITPYYTRKLQRAEHALAAKSSTIGALDRKGAGVRKVAGPPGDASGSLSNGTPRCLPAPLREGGGGSCTRQGSKGRSKAARSGWAFFFFGFQVALRPCSWGVGRVVRGFSEMRFDSWFRIVWRNLRGRWILWLRSKYFYCNGGLMHLSRNTGKKPVSDRS